MCIVYWLNLVANNVEIGCDNLNRVWMTALDTNVISGDENHDGELLISDIDKDNNTYVNVRFT
jgi:hypothetical protein